MNSAIYPNTLYSIFNIVQEQRGKHKQCVDVIFNFVYVHVCKSE